jgi:hypothetical protein
MRCRRSPVVASAVLLMVLGALVGLAPASSQDKPAREPDVIYVPTPQEVVDKMLEMADVRPGEVVYDLGCGDGARQT